MIVSRNPLMGTSDDFTNTMPLFFTDDILSRSVVRNDLSHSGGKIFRQCDEQQGHYDIKSEDQLTVLDSFDSYVKPSTPTQRKKEISADSQRNSVSVERKFYLFNLSIIQGVVVLPSSEYPEIWKRALPTEWGRL